MNLSRVVLRTATSAGIGIAVLLLGAGLLGTDDAQVQTAPGAPPPLTLVGLGDSVTAGTHCDCTPFVQLTGDLLARSSGRQVRSINDGTAGLQTAGLLDALAPGTSTARDVSSADVVLVTIGANDLHQARADWPDCDQACSTAGVPQIGINLEKVVREIRTLRAGRPVAVVVTGYWNVFEDGQQALSELGPAFSTWSDRLTATTNQVIRAAAVQTGATYVDLKAPFLGDGSIDPTPLLASDGDHPNAAGHRAIAAACAKAIINGRLLPSVPTPAPAATPAATPAANPRPVTTTP